MKFESLAIIESAPSKKIVFQNSDSIDDLINRLELPLPKGLIILNDGICPASNHVRLRIKTLMDRLAELVVEDGLTVIDGGIKSGAFELFSESLQKVGGSCAPYIGVAVKSKAARYGLGDQHSHIVLLEDGKKKDDSDIIYHLAKTIDVNCPSIALFVGGGELAIEQMLRNVRQYRKMLFFAGSSGTTDQVLQAGVLTEPSDSRFRKIFYEGHIVPFGIYQPTGTLKSIARNLLIS